MTLKTWIQIMSFATVTALMYINMQTQIVDLAYQGKDKQTSVHKLLDTNGALTHQILALKSANNLGNRLLEKDSNMQFMGKDRVMTLVLSAREARAWDH
ncbi:MAG: hypothetical protein Q7K71_00200 [Candidatus Omnitrophota bacterium]|nr:hypothetical protein [Candidatus Omnitrophota bacterium]